MPLSTNQQFKDDTNNNPDDDFLFNWILLPLMALATVTLLYIVFS